jgi:hypothetical protein
MAKKEQYPLAQVLAVKKDRVDKALKLAESKKQALAIEEEKLKKVEAERDQVKNHRDDKLRQIKEAFDIGTTSDEILQKKAYLKVVEEKLVKSQQKVTQQLEMVKKAQKALEEALEQLKQRRLEEQKISLHKQEWEKQMKIEQAREEAKEHDEIGQLIHESLKRKRTE